MTVCNAPAPESLCEAGFYYEGLGDRMCCFWCDGALENGAPSEDPWREHARWYLGCRFVYLVKGSRFIVDVQRELSDEERRYVAELVYNEAGTDFLREPASEPEYGGGGGEEVGTARDVDIDVDPAWRVRSKDWYVVLNGLGFKRREL